MSANRRFLYGLGAATALLISSTASAGLLPPGFEIVAEWGGNTWTATNNPDQFSYTPNGDGGVISGFSQVEDWTASWGNISFTGNPSQTNAFVVTNTSASTQTFTITITTPGSLPGPTIMYGSIAGALTDNGLNGATFSAPSGGAVYTALIDGSAVATLWDDPFSVSTGSPPFTASLGSAQFNGIAGPSVTTDISIVHTFTLTAGDSATINSAFVVIPGPGGLAILAGGLLLGRRRRR